MKSKFISTGLAAARRSLPADRNGAVPPPSETAVPPASLTPTAQADLDALMRKEQARLLDELRQKGCVEFHKHRQSLLPELREWIDHRQASLQAMETQVETLTSAHEALTAVMLPDEGEVSLTELRAARKILDTARLELLKIQRAPPAGLAPADTPVRGAEITPAMPLAGLGFKRATLLGLFLTLPLIAALLLGALFVGICLLSVFKG